MCKSPPQRRRSAAIADNGPFLNQRSKSYQEFGGQMALTLELSEKEAQIEQLTQSKQQLEQLNKEQDRKIDKYVHTITQLQSNSKSAKCISTKKSVDCYVKNGGSYDMYQ